MTAMRQNLLLICLAGFVPAAASAQEREAVLLEFPASPSVESVEQLGTAGVEIGEFVGGTTYYGSVPVGGLAQAQDSAAAIPSGPAIAAVPAQQKLDGLDIPRAGQGGGQGGAQGVTPVQGTGTDAPLAVVIAPAVNAGDTAMRAQLEELPVEILDANETRGWIVRVKPSDLQRLAEQPMIESLSAVPADAALE